MRDWIPENSGGVMRRFLRLSVCIIALCVAAQSPARAIPVVDLVQLPLSIGASISGPAGAIAMLMAGQSIPRPIIQPYGRWVQVTNTAQTIRELLTAATVPTDACRNGVKVFNPSTTQAVCLGGASLAGVEDVNTTVTAPTGKCWPICSGGPPTCAEGVSSANITADRSSLQSSVNQDVVIICGSVQ